MSAVIKVLRDISIAMLHDKVENNDHQYANTREASQYSPSEINPTVLIYNLLVQSAMTQDRGGGYIQGCYVNDHINMWLNFTVSMSFPYEIAMD